ncbi:HTH-type transcriptional regulator AscG [Vibrio aerogenes CECT 7868]|uniref:HTH-type transcriptional regulator AscG n=1 Tax=Vibrio aerogenes CECT 7868 TaxID=1216006 RepID=A0A1M5VXF3_9VIBR|nr:LacI family DNA-binding transcriptional regulator [Vibrio aerogenes]SHH79916.1 HTH-type transcriptional regulator AscG [Vibrio aerogenes CECT 7868]
MTTIADVCKAAGVSKATVSRVLNNTGQVSDATRQKVITAVNALNYRPSSVARALITRKTNTIGLVVPEFEGAYYGSLLKQAASSSEGYEKQLIVTDGHNDPVMEKEAILLLSDRCCDAIILYSRHMPEKMLAELIQRIQIPVVTINRQFSSPALPCITFDQAGAAYMITSYLLQMGHRQIACITGELKTHTGIARLQGYRQALAEFDIPFDPALTESGHNHFMEGYQACKNLLSRPVKFTAILACSDEMAVGSLKALTEKGISVPEHMSIGGIDNSPISQYAFPPLTTVSIPIEEMTESAIHLALKLAQNQTSPNQIEFTGRVINRNSILPVSQSI